MLGAGVAFAAALSCAQADAQIYIGGEGGWTHLNDSKTRGTIAGAALNNTEKFDEGYNVGARVGYQWGPWRFEGEYSYRRNKLNSYAPGGLAPVALVGGTFVPVAPSPPFGTSPGTITGADSSHAVMANVIYDFTLGWPITPHIGAGIGGADVRFERSSSTLGTIVHDDQWEFAYQAIGGIRYDISPSLAFDLDYRYFATMDPSFRARNIGGNIGSVKTEYSSHNVVAALTVKFGVPPAPVPVQQPLPPQTGAIPSTKVFLVFFDWDRDTITPEGSQIIRQAANAYQAGQRTRIQVTGYTDRSGSTAYNQRLSERRANNVANALTRFGVPRSDMSVSGRGENDNRVPTADGVREPQNRRVEIVFP